MIPEPLLAAIYQGPLEDEPWLGFVQSLRERYRAIAANITLRLPEPGHPGFDVADSDWDVRVLREHYTSLYYTDNPFHYDDMQPGRVYRWSDFVDRERFHRSAYYRDFCQPAGFEYALCLGVRAEGLGAWVHVVREPGGGDFDAGDCALLEALGPHLERALTLYGRIRRSESARTAYETAIEQLAIGTLLLDRHGRIISVNAAARDIAGELRREDGSLRLAQPALDTELRRHLETVLAGRSSGEALAVPRPGLAPLGLLLRPFPGGDGGDRPALIVYVSDPASHQLAPEGLVARLFGLTPTEARLAVLLADGLTIAEAARHMHVSEGSARSYCKRIFAKTGISRQAELIRLLLKSVAMLAAEDPPRPPRD